MYITLFEGYSGEADRNSDKLYRFQIKIYISAVNEMNKFLFWSVLFYFLFETADLRSYCGYFLAIFQLCFLMGLKLTPDIIRIDLV